MDNEEYFNEKLNLDDLYKQQKITEDHKIKIYQKILARIHNKMKYTSRMRNNNKFCVLRKNKNSFGRKQSCYIKSGLCIPKSLGK